MNIDIDDIESRINDGIYGGDHMSDTQRDDAFAALAEILAEVETLRAEVVAERVAVVAWLRAGASNHRGFGVRLIGDELDAYADHIERGEHRREEAK